MRSFQTVVVGAISSVLFTLLVLCASFITTYFTNIIENPGLSYNSFFYSYYIDPWDVGRDLVRAAIRIIKDENAFGTDDDPFFSQATGSADSAPAAAPGILKRLLKRFILGLPVVGAGSLVQMMLSLPFLGPLQWLARFR